MIPRSKSRSGSVPSSGSDATVAAPRAELVVISPHLDDAVLSLGAFIAKAGRSARCATVLTVFAGDPDSRAPAGGWDRRAGFATEGEAATTRRLEDRQACRLLRADPSWLPFSEADYRGTLDGDAVWAAVADRLSAAAPEDVLVPGFPLTNPDHEWISRLFVERKPPCRRLGLYAEQPYRFSARHERPGPMTVAAWERGVRTEWARVGRDPRDVWSKRRAILAYRSQLSLLGLSRNRPRRLSRMLVHETMRGGEAIMWLDS
jgi:LmbE family N-acetylglucosaminyl deacetylase